MTTTFELTARFEPVENGWVQAQILEIPGVITAAETQAQAEDLLVDALREYLLALSGDSAADGDDTATERPVAVTIDI